MADITMCTGTGCPLREKCYRYTATPNEYRQSFADFTTKLTAEKDGYGENGTYCPEYVPIAKVRGDAPLYGAASLSTDGLCNGGEK